MHVLETRGTSLPEIDREIDAITALVQEVGTRTYTRQEYARQMVEGRVEDPQIYHCYHMCRDTAALIRESGTPAWSVMGVFESNGFKQLHPIVIAECSQKTLLFDPAFGILRGVEVDDQKRETPDGKFTISNADGTITLFNSASNKSFIYQFSPEQPSFSTADNLLVRRNNFPGDAYSMTYRYDCNGGMVANISFFHLDKDDKEHGAMLIMRRNPAGVLESKKFGHFQVTTNDKEFTSWLNSACTALDANFDQVRESFLFLAFNVGDLRSIQVSERRRELERQLSGKPLW